jgi:hypothetical protein
MGSSEVGDGGDGEGTDREDLLTLTSCKIQYLLPLLNHAVDLSVFLFDLSGFVHMTMYNILLLFFIRFFSRSSKNSCVCQIKTH